MTRRPLLIASACFGSLRCRYDGQTLSCPHLTDLLDSAEVRFVCPEIEIGLAVPRDPIRLIFDDHLFRMIQTGTGRDLTEAIERFSEKFFSSLAPTEIGGFLLKSRSPSCALFDAKVYAKDGETLIGISAGVFGAAVLRRFPTHPITDERRVLSSKERTQFLEAISRQRRFS